jgi:WD40 repeat protein
MSSTKSNKKIKKKPSKLKQTTKGNGPISTVGKSFQPIPCEDVILDVSFHPYMGVDNNNNSKHTLCAALVTGDVQIFESSSSSELQFSNIAVIRNLYPENEYSSCRTICFDYQGRVLYTGGENGTLHGIDASRGVAVWNAIHGHSSAVNRVSNVLTSIHGPWALLSGDEIGTIQIWDARQPGKSPVAQNMGAHNDFISDFVCPSIHQLQQLQQQQLSTSNHPQDSTNIIISASGDGTMSVLDMRNLSRVVQSVELETELLSITTIKNNTRIVTGTQEGALNFWSLARNGHAIGDGPTGGFTGHPHSVDCILKLNEDIILTGSSDGIIRVVQVLPNRLLGVIGYHDDFPVERMSWSSNKMIIATCSHDNLIRIWDTEIFNVNAGELMEDGEDIEDSNDNNDDDNDGDEMELMGDDDDENGEDDEDDQDEDFDMDDDNNNNGGGFFQGL